MYTPGQQSKTVEVPSGLQKKYFLQLPGYSKVWPTYSHSGGGGVVVVGDVVVVVMVVVVVVIVVVVVVVMVVVVVVAVVVVGAVVVSVVVVGFGVVVVGSVGGMRVLGVSKHVPGGAWSWFSHSSVWGSKMRSVGLHL